MVDVFGGFNMTEATEQFVAVIWLLVPLILGLVFVYAFRDGIRDFLGGAMKGLSKR